MSGQRPPALERSCQEELWGEGRRMESSAGLGGAFIARATGARAASRHERALWSSGEPGRRAHPWAGRRGLELGEGRRDRSGH